MGEIAVSWRGFTGGGGCRGSRLGKVVCNRQYNTIAEKD